MRMLSGCYYLIEHEGTPVIFKCKFHTPKGHQGALFREEPTPFFIHDVLLKVYVQFGQKRPVMNDVMTKHPEFFV